MNIPSFSFIYRNASDPFHRFPFTILTASVAAISANWLIEIDNQEKDPYKFLHKVITTAILGIPLFTATVVTVERWKPDVHTL